MFNLNFIQSYFCLFFLELLEKLKIHPNDEELKQRKSIPKKEEQKFKPQESKPNTDSWPKEHVDAIKRFLHLICLFCKILNT